MLQYREPLRKNENNKEIQKMKERQLPGVDGMYLQLVIHLKYKYVRVLIRRCVMTNSNDLSYLLNVFVLNVRTRSMYPRKSVN